MENWKSLALKGNDLQALNRLMDANPTWSADHAKHVIDAYLQGVLDGQSMMDEKTN